MVFRSQLVCAAASATHPAPQQSCATGHKSRIYRDRGEEKEIEKEREIMEKRKRELDMSKGKGALTYVIQQ